MGNIARALRIPGNVYLFLRAAAKHMKMEEKKSKGGGSTRYHQYIASLDPSIPYQQKLVMWRQFRSQPSSPAPSQTPPIRSPDEKRTYTQMRVASTPPHYTQPRCTRGSLCQQRHS